MLRFKSQDRLYTDISTYINIIIINIPILTKVE